VFRKLLERRRQKRRLINAGGATEADDAGASIELISEGLTHSNTVTTTRYIRRRKAKMDALARECRLSIIT
jgi:hypothetical protein